MIVRVSDVYVGSHKADRVLWLTALCPHREVGTAYHKHGKRSKIQIFKVQFLLTSYCFHTTMQSKNPSTPEVGTAYLLQLKKQMAVYLCQNINL